MNTKLLVLAAAGFVYSATACAQVPNGGFENWITVDTYQDPVGWVTFNSITALGGEVSCEQGTTGAPEGNSYMQVTTINVAALGGVIPGLAYTGDAATQGFGYAYTSRPTTLEGQVQFGIMPLDTGAVAVQFTKWDPISQTTIDVGVGAMMLVADQGSWQSFSIPIMYNTQDTPDSAAVLVASSLGSTPVAGSFVKVDALSFGVSSGIAQVDEVPSLRIYPSPATDMVNVTADSPIAEVNVMDLTGRTVLLKGLNTERAVIGVSDLPAGRYLMQVQMVDGMRQVRSFVKQ